MRNCGKDVKQKKKKKNLQNWTNKKKMTEKLDNEEVKAKLKEEEN